MYIAKCSDELWIGVKCQTNPEIAGSRRNNFRVSVIPMNCGGKALNGLRGLVLTEPNQTPNAIAPENSSRTTGDEFRGREGKNPDRQLRSQSDS